MYMMHIIYYNYCLPFDDVYLVVEYSVTGTAYHTDLPLLQLLEMSFSYRSDYELTVSVSYPPNNCTICVLHIWNVFRDSLTAVYCSHSLLRCHNLLTFNFFSVVRYLQNFLFVFQYYVLSKGQDKRHHDYLSITVHEFHLQFVSFLIMWWNY